MNVAAGHARRPAFARRWSDGRYTRSRRRRRRIDRQRSRRRCSERVLSWRFFPLERSITSRRTCRFRSSCTTAARVAHRGPAVDVRLDAASVNGRVFLNTSSVGAYVTFVRARERLEQYLGYHIASFVAAVQLLFRLPTFRVTLTGRGSGTRVHHASRVHRGRRARAQAAPRLARASRTERPGFT